jgi:hypothetical protein
VVSFDEDSEVFKVEKTIGKAYFREFKKAYYQMIFDSKWCDEMLEIEHQHAQLTSLLLVYAHKIKSEQYMSVNPIEQRKADYGCETDLPPEFSHLS